MVVRTRIAVTTLSAFFMAAGRSWSPNFHTPAIPSAAASSNILARTVIPRDPADPIRKRQSWVKVTRTAVVVVVLYVI